ncbi:hypothetical protein PGTUg99_030954 [Puccinia graminis f. sp. tritici]|uniref:Uncharacterized protein n=1 Tax=Puccinia graminis f. sp. tritici TaxID=56615 RepID=A0A5B0SFX1_PUCGR|nr:hypothetical protein PGTUg99_030954 [Puccinia graminis f. sp. tritici]
MLMMTPLQAGSSGWLLEGKKRESRTSSSRQKLRGPRHSGSAFCNHLIRSIKRLTPLPTCPSPFTLSRSVIDFGIDTLDHPTFIFPCLLSNSSNRSLSRSSPFKDLALFQSTPHSPFA